MYFVLVDFLPIIMFVTLGVLLFSGYPVAFVLGGVGLGFGLIGYGLDVFRLIEFYNLLPRIWGGIAENLVLVAVPMFVFMGTMLERSGVAEDLLHSLQVMMRRIPGGLALAVTVMGTIMAATTGIIGASVVMITLMALPVMLERRYNKELATGTIAASGTLGILIPPSIMLVTWPTCSRSRSATCSSGRCSRAWSSPGCTSSTSGSSATSGRAWRPRCRPRRGRRVRARWPGWSWSASSPRRF